MGKQDEYEKAKRTYHAAGRKAKGTRQNSTERKDYATAKRAYRKAGRELKA